jgi:chromate transporter
VETPTPKVHSEAQPASAGHTSLVELAWLFLKLGAIAFGGPPAHIAMMEDEVVTRRGWLRREEFLDFLGAANVIPGPTSTELALHVGRIRAGWLGLLVAGSSFILPSTLAVTALAWAYLRFGSSPHLLALLYGVKPVVIAVIIQAILKLGKSAVKSVWLGALLVLALGCAVVRMHELLVLLTGGLLGTLPQLTNSRRRLRSSLPGFWPLGGTQLAGSAVAAGMAAPFTLAGLFLVFLKIGATLFGGGYLLVAFMRSDLVARLHWISERQLLDAIAAGQITPGPLSTTATFVGYLLAGLPGSVVATVAIFLPAFFLVAISGPFVPRLRQSRLAGAALDGVNVAALALMVVVTYQLARTAFVDWPTAALGMLSVWLLLRYRLNSAWLVVGGAITGAIASTLNLR